MSQIFPILHIIVLVVLLLFLLLLVGGVKKTRLSIYLSFLYVFIIAWLALEFFAMNFEFDGELNALFWKITFSSVAIVSFLTFKTTVSAFNKKINKNFDIF